MNHCLQIASPLDRFISLLERLDDSSNRLHIGLGVGKLVFPEGVLWDKENRVTWTFWVIKWVEKIKGGHLG